MGYVVAVLVALVVVAGVVLSGPPPRPPRYRHWRGPTAGTRDEVQWEHLDLFFPRDDQGDDE